MDGDDLAFAGLVAQARALRDRELSSRELVDATLERIDALDGRLNAFCQVYAEPARAAARAADERLAAGRGAAAAGGARGDQGRRRRRGRRDHLRHRRRGPARARGLRGGPPPARSRSGAGRADQRARAAAVAVHRVQDVRDHPQPLEPRAHARWLQRGLGGRGGGGDGARRAGLGRRGLDPHPRVLLRAVRPQDPARPHLARSALGRRPHLARHGGIRAAGPTGGGRGAVPGRHRPDRRRQLPARQPARARRPADRRLAQAAAGPAGGRRGQGGGGADGCHAHVAGPPRHSP